MVRGNPAGKWTAKPLWPLAQLAFNNRLTASWSAENPMA